MRKPFLFIATILILASLAACSKASDSERGECEARDGQITSERYAFTGDGTGWSGKRTGKLEFCELPSGAMVTVYNEEIVKLDTGFFGVNDDNQKVFKECKILGGKTYKTRTPGKYSKTRYACVRDGKYVQIL